VLKEARENTKKQQGRLREKSRGEESRNEKEDKIVLLGTRFTSITHITYNP
jgi:hypothetical protein